MYSACVEDTVMHAYLGSDSRRSLLASSSAANVSDTSGRLVLVATCIAPCHEFVLECAVVVRGCRTPYNPICCV
jgi:hypothetical protein